MSFSRYPWWRRWFGLRSERAAAGFLRGLGYRVIAANVTTAGGELDLLALDGDTLVAVEVRSTESDDLSAVALSIDAKKQRRVTRATLAWLSERKMLDRIATRFDVLLVSWPPEAREPAIRHVRHAFDADNGRYQMHG